MASTLSPSAAGAAALGLETDWSSGRLTQEGFAEGGASAKGSPSEYDLWPVTFRNYDDMKRVTGLSHVTCLGCMVAVHLDVNRIESRHCDAAEKSSASRHARAQYRDGDRLGAAGVRGRTP